MFNKLCSWFGMRICARCGKPFWLSSSRGSYECDRCIGIIMRELIADQLATKYNDGADPDLMHNPDWLEAARPWM